MLEPYTTRTPVDDMEPLPDESLAHEMASKAMRTIYMAVQHIKSPYHGLAVGVASLEFAMDLREDSMRDAARELGVTVAALSHATKQACDALGLQPGNSMRGLKARKAYRAARVARLKKRPAGAKPAAKKRKAGGI